jgi:cell division protein FtsW
MIVTSSLLIVSAIMGLAATLLASYRMSRFQSFLQILINGEPSNTFKRGESFQVWNGLVALGLGGLLGVGYGQSKQKLFFLQEAAYTDSIFSIVGEEFGLLGTLAVILGFLVILSIGLKIAKEAPNKYLFLFASGITAWIIIQAFLNIAANLALIPFGGIPLPFLTYGGSNTIMILIGVGLLLNISKKRLARS